MRLYTVLAVFAVVVLATTAATPALAPRWPTPALDYWIAASEALTQLDGVALGLFRDIDFETLKADAENALDILNELDPPPALLATHAQLRYATAVCWQAADFSIELQKDSSGAVFAIAPLTTMRLECARSVKDARVEASRYAATVGGFPDANN